MLIGYVLFAEQNKKCEELESLVHVVVEESEETRFSEGKLKKTRKITNHRVSKDSLGQELVDGFEALEYQEDDEGSENDLIRTIRKSQNPNFSIKTRYRTKEGKKHTEIELTGDTFNPLVQKYISSVTKSMKKAASANISSPTAHDFEAKVMNIKSGDDTFVIRYQSQGKEIFATRHDKAEIDFKPTPHLSQETRSINNALEEQDPLHS